MQTDPLHMRGLKTWSFRELTESVENIFHANRFEGKVQSVLEVSYSLCAQTFDRSGSVKTEYDIVFNGDADLTDTQLEDALKNSLTSNTLGDYAIDTSTISVSGE